MKNSQYKKKSLNSSNNNKSATVVNLEFQEKNKGIKNNFIKGACININSIGITGGSITSMNNNIQNII